VVDEAIEQRVTRLVREYADAFPEGTPLDARLSLRDDLAIESMSLLSLTLRLGEEMGVDVSELGLELGHLKTLGDLFGLARTLSRRNSGIHHGS
jgi:acyl carrier protein